MEGLNIPKINLANTQQEASSNSGGTTSSAKAVTVVSNNTSGLIVETAVEMVNMPRLFRILNFGKPSTGKTHFGFTMPETVILIDTEGRGHLIVGKFKVCKDCEEEWYTPSLICPSCKSKNIRNKDIRRIQVRSMKELYKAVEIAISILNDIKEKTGKVGTLMIDSYTRAWLDAQNEHTKNKYGDGNTYVDVKLDPMADYKFINPRHNNLRDTILDSGFNVYLTATLGNVFGEDRYNPIGVKPEGQKHNEYAVDYFMFTFQRSNQLITRIEKNSIAKTTAEEIPNMDYKRLLILADKFEKQEKMLTSTVIDSIAEQLEKERNEQIIEETSDVENTTKEESETIVEEESTDNTIEESTTEETTTEKETTPVEETSEEPVETNKIILGA